MLQLMARGHKLRQAASLTLICRRWTHLPHEPDAPAHSSALQHRYSCLLWMEHQEVRDFSLVQNCSKVLNKPMAGQGKAADKAASSLVTHPAAGSSVWNGQCRTQGAWIRAVPPYR